MGALLALPLAAWATDEPPMSSDHGRPMDTRPLAGPDWEAGVLGSYGVVQGHGDPYNVVTFRFFIGYRLLSSKAANMSLTLRIELLGAGYSDTASGSEFGIVPGIRLKFHWGLIAPYLECGIGPVYNDLDTNNFAPGLNFRSHGGLGIDIAISDDAYFTVGGRISHISNAGANTRNQGITPTEGLVGLTFRF